MALHATPRRHPQDKTDWEAAKRLLGDATFIKRLMEYDRDNIPHKVVRQLKRIIDDPNFTPEQVRQRAGPGVRSSIGMHGFTALPFRAPLKGAVHRP